MDEHFEIDIPGKFSDSEEAILDYLYGHPDEKIGTKDLVRSLRAEQPQAYEEIRYGVETLIAAALARGKRISDSGRICSGKPGR